MPKTTPNIRKFKLIPVKVQERDHTSATPLPTFPINTNLTPSSSFTLFCDLHPVFLTLFLFSFLSHRLLQWIPHLHLHRSKQAEEQPFSIALNSFILLMMLSLLFNQWYLGTSMCSAVLKPELTLTLSLGNFWQHSHFKGWASAVHELIYKRVVHYLIKWWHSEQYVHE